MGRSRRELVKGGALAVAGLAVAGRAARAAVRAKRRWAYAGSYSSSLDSGHGNGQGIYLLEQDTATGALRVVGLAAKTRNPSWLAIDAAGRYLYAADEVSDFGGTGGVAGTSGAVSAYAIDAGSGALRLLTTVSSEGAGPAHLSLDLAGRFVFVANYFGGTVAVLPVLPDGGVGKAVFVGKDTGSVGSTRATSGPPGSFAISGHDRPHAHMIQADPSGRFVLHTDLGQDRLYVDRLDATTGRLSPAAVPFVALPSGDGPRHFVFDHTGRRLYLLEEEASTVSVARFDPETGAVTVEQTLSTLPPGFAGTSFTSEILLSHDGRSLYAANRLHDTIAVFRVQADGRLRYAGEVATEGDYPRYLGLDPEGQYLYACNQRSDDVTCFRVNWATGMPVFTGGYTGVGSPACVVFLSR